MKYEATVSVDHSSVAWGAEAMGALGHTTIRDCPPPLITLSGANF